MIKYLYKMMIIINEEHTRRAGKFTPAASVDVQQITQIIPSLKASSSNRLSSAVKPE